MFGNQLKALRQSITAANRIADPVKAIDAYTDILTEALRNGKKTYPVAAILFLDDDKRADVYYRRADAYAKLAQRSLGQKNVPDAVEYYNDALTDTDEAISACESLHKKNAIRRKLCEYEAAISKIEQNQVIATPDVSRKRELEKSSDTESESSVSEKTPSAGYHLRNIRMWNPKKEYEDKVDRLEDERLGNTPKRNKR